MNLDPFNEFPLLNKRWDKQFEYLKRVRHLIDPRISDEDIMTAYDYGLDAVALFQEKIKEYEEKIKEYDTHAEVPDLNKLDKELITLTKSDVMFLIASAMGYGWNEASSRRSVKECNKRKELEQEKLLEWSITRNQNEQIR